MVLYSTHEHRLSPANSIAAIRQGILKAEVNVKVAGVKFAGQAYNSILKSILKLEITILNFNGFCEKIISAVLLPCIVKTRQVGQSVTLREIRL